MTCLETLLIIFCEFIKLVFEIRLHFNELVERERVRRAKIYWIFILDAEIQWDDYINNVKTSIYLSNFNDLC